MASVNFQNKSAVFLILKTSQEIHELITERIKDEVRKRLLNFNLTQEAIADWLVTELHLSDSHVAAAKKVITDLNATLLTSQERGK